MFYDICFTGMEADYCIFFIFQAYKFFQFNIPSMSVDILGISFPMTLLLYEKPSITIANGLSVVFDTESLV